MNMLLSKAAEVVTGELIGNDIEFSALSIDTRTLNPGDIYLAIKGLHYDGHDFLAQAEQAGAGAVIVDRKYEIGLPQIEVEDTRIALAELARFWKKNADVKTIAVTGSNGKTTVKEMIAAILAVDDKVWNTQGNLNNDIGVPLTLLKLKSEHQYAVIEMGANHPGEIEYSCQYAEPDVAMITNVGAAHIEGFGSLEGVAKAKSEIYQSLATDGIAIVNIDDGFYPMWEQIIQSRTNNVIRFGLNESADVRADNIAVNTDNNCFITQFDLITEQGQVVVQMQLAGQHNVLNALAATASALAVGKSLKQIKQGLESIKPVTGRLQPLVGVKGNLVIDDTYNANPNSVKAALDVLMQCKGEPWVVLGALGEMGSDTLNIHKDLGELMKSMNVVRLLTIGSDAKSTSNVFGKGATFFNSQTELIDSLKSWMTGNETLLVKGSRSQKMENVVAALVNDFRK